jgi:putative DNA primase/helicase
MAIHDYDEHEFDPDTNTTTTSAVKPPVLDAKSPSVSAREFISRRITRLIYWRKEFYTWIGLHYEARSKEEINAEVRQFLDGGMTEQLGQFHANIQKISEVVDAIRAAVMVPDRYEAGTNLCTGLTRSLIPCRNGMLDMNTRALIPHSDEWLVLSSLPFEYNPTPAEPIEWLKFINSLFPGDVEAITTLQEIIGYLVSGRTDLQKIFLLKGPQRSGKGTLVKVIERLIGTHNYVGISMGRLSDDKYALHEAIGKTLMVVPDSRDFASLNIGKVTEDFLTISGEDSISVQRKYLGAWIGRLSTRILILSNVMPKLFDKSGVVASRFVPIKLNVSFYGCEDLKLFEKLLPELPAVFNWALDGLGRLVQRGSFIIPASARELLDDLTETAAHELTFMRECIVEDADCVWEKLQFYKVYCRWCNENGHNACSADQFCRNIRDLNIPWVEQIRPHGKPRLWKGFRARGEDDNYALSPDAQKVRNHLDGIFI